MKTIFSDKIQSRPQIRRGAYSTRFAKLILVALIPVIFFCLVNSPPVAAQSAGEYFQMDFGSANLSQSQVSGSALFSALISGRVTCIKDLPVSEASITSRVIAENTVNGNRVELNPSYTVTIKPFPSKAGQTFDIKQSVPLQFPALAESGIYNVIAEIIEAKVKVAFVWLPVTEFLPQRQSFGSVKYVVPIINQAPLPTPIVTPAPSTVLLVPALPQAPASTPVPTRPVATPNALPKPGFAWWMWLIVAIVVVITVVSIKIILKRRI